jgi:hypothetical protein
VADDVLWADQGPHTAAHPKSAGAKMNGLRPRWPSGRRELGVTSIKVRFCCRHLLRLPHLPFTLGGRRPEKPIALTPERPLRDPRISAASSRDSFAPLMPPEEPFRNASAVPLAAPPPGPSARYSDRSEIGQITRYQNRTVYESAAFSVPRTCRSY